MRTLLTIGIILFPAFGALAAECPLQGKWKSDAARTLADIATRDSFEDGALNTVSEDLIGHMVHEWTCSEFRAYLEDSEPADAVAYQIREREAESFIVTVNGATKFELKIAFEGACYKVLAGGRQFYEYFCPV